MSAYNIVHTAGRTVTVEREGYISSLGYDWLPRIAEIRAKRHWRIANRTRRRLAKAYVVENEVSDRSRIDVLNKSFAQHVRESNRVIERIGTSVISLENDRREGNVQWRLSSLEAAVFRPVNECAAPPEPAKNKGKK